MIYPIDIVLETVFLIIIKRSAGRYLYCTLFHFKYNTSTLYLRWIGLTIVYNNYTQILATTVICGVHEMTIKSNTAITILLNLSLPNVMFNRAYSREFTRSFITKTFHLVRGLPKDFSHLAFLLPGHLLNNLCTSPPSIHDLATRVLYI